MVRKVLLGIVVVALLAFGSRVFLFGPSDRTLILEALDRSIQASQEGKPGGVLEYLSRSLTYNGQPVTNRSELGQFIKENRPKVTVLRREPVIQENSAYIDSPVEIFVGIGPIGRPIQIQMVRIGFRKETGTRWLVVPYPKWRVDSVDVKEFDAGQIESLF